MTIRSYKYRKIDEIPFDFERRRISVLLDDGISRLLIIKGAPEDVINLSTLIESGDGDILYLDQTRRSKLLYQFEQFGSDGYRVLGVASRPRPKSQNDATISHEADLTFAGFLTFLDPPKSDASSSLEALSRRGVEVNILTGDNEKITRHVCREIGFDVKGILTGQDLNLLTERA